MSKTISELQFECHKIAKEHGFWDEPRNDAEMIALMHSELSEALEGLRKNNWIGKGGVNEEMADTVIRILDFCQYHGVDLGYEIVKKMEKNRKRKYKHGKKF